MDNPPGLFIDRTTKKSKRNCGVVTYKYFNIHDSDIEYLLDSLEAELEDYKNMWQKWKVNNRNCIDKSILSKKKKFECIINCNSDENFASFNFLFYASLIKICSCMVVHCVWLITVYLPDSWKNNW